MSEQEPAEWGCEGGDGHGYRYQYIGPIHYLCECGDYFLNRDRWIAHKALIEASEFIRDTSGIGLRETSYADGWYDAIEYAIGELNNRAADPELSRRPADHLPPK